VNGALRHPALQGAAGVGAFTALTWPLLVFDRPVYVVLSFFVIWIVVIALLLLFSRAPDGPDPAFGSDSGDSPSSDDTTQRGSNGGGDARGH
jgi:hypothetical protein